jgi:type VI secretion system secreted protein Hcp
MAVDMFFRIGDLKGESSDRTHPGEISVLAWSWGLSQSGTTQQRTGEAAGRVNVQDISFTKYLDKASPSLMLYCCNGNRIPEAILTVRKAGDRPLEYVVIKFNDVLVSSISVGGSAGEDRLTENVTLNFAEIHVSYQAQKPDGAKDGEPIVMGWNVATNAEQ